MRRCNLWSLPIMAGLGVILGLIVVFAKKPEPKADILITPPTNMFNTAVAGIGAVEPSSEAIAVGTDISGLVKSIEVKIGEEVNKGTILFTLDDTLINAEINSLQCMLLSAKIQAADADSQFAIVNKLKNKQAIAKEEYNKRKFNNRLAKSKVKELQAKLQQALAHKKKLQIKAPIDGQILAINVRIGEFAASGMLKDPILVMGNTKILHVRVELDEENFNRLISHELAKGFTRSDTKRGIPLKFLYTEPYVRPKNFLAVNGQRIDTKVAQIVFQVMEDDPKLLVGQQLDVFIPAKEINT